MPAQARRLQLVPVFFIEQDQDDISCLSNIIHQNCDTSHSTCTVI